MIKFAHNGKVLVYSESGTLAKRYAVATGKVIEIVPNEVNTQDGNEVASVKQVEVSAVIGWILLLPLIVLTLFGFAVILNEVINK